MVMQSDILKNICLPQVGGGTKNVRPMNNLYQKTTQVIEQHVVQTA